MEQVSEIDWKQEIEKKWNLVCSLRAELNRLWEQGEPLTSDRLIQLGVEINRQGTELMDMDRRYEDLLLEGVTD